MSLRRRRMVRLRGDQRCEYCHLPDFALEPEQWHVEHIRARQHGGKDELENLCWCCGRCNSKKGPNLTAIDPLTDELVRLYNPRKQKWKVHFQWVGNVVLGRTGTGRATIALLHMNEPNRLALRKRLRQNDDWSDPD